MKTLLKRLWLGALALLLSSQVALAEDPRAFRQEELDQMLAPIALYPDSLLSQILMASTYPLEVVEAARWAKAHPGLTGQAAADAADSETWDPSVKSLLAFPQVLSMMDEKLDWTRRLGDAFIAQEPQVMETIQGLRQRAYDAGNLREAGGSTVTRQPDGNIVVERSDPSVVYVPYYDPAVVYGPWWYPAYPPVYWAPWPGYYLRPAYSAWCWWGPPIAISAGFFFGSFNWAHHHAQVASVTNVTNITNVKNVNVTPKIGAEKRWSHDPAHRGNVSYRQQSARQQFAHSRQEMPRPRPDFRPAHPFSPSQQGQSNSQRHGQPSPRGEHGQSRADTRPQPDRKPTQNWSNQRQQQAGWQPQMPRAQAWSPQARGSTPQPQARNFAPPQQARGSAPQPQARSFAPSQHYSGGGMQRPAMSMHGSGGGGGPRMGGGRRG